MYIRDPGVVIPHYIIGKLTKMTKNHEKSWLNKEQVSIVRPNQPPMLGLIITTLFYFD